MPGRRARHSDVMDRDDLSSICRVQFVGTRARKDAERAALWIGSLSDIVTVLTALR